jgi:hypothetical protein
MSSSSWRRKKPRDDKAQLKSQNVSCKLQSEEKSGARIQILLFSVVLTFLICNLGFVI